MNTVARFWLLLTASYIAAHGLLFALVWRTIDLRLETVAQHVVIPFLQAAALAWVAGAFSLRNCARSARQAVSRPLVAVLWCAEGALLFAYWGLESGTDLTGLVARAAGLEALLASVVILIRLFSFPSANFRTWIAILPFVLLMLALGTNRLKPWFNHLPSWLPEGWPFLLRQMVILGATVVSLIVFTGKAQKVLSTRNPLAGLILGWLQLFFIVAVIALVVNGYLYAFLVSPWRQVITTSLSLAATCLLTAALCLLPPQEPGRARTGPANQILKRPMGFFGLWFTLALCALAAALLLRILLFRHWDWSAKTLLSLGLVPLVQASWFRWAWAMGTGWKQVPGLIRSRPLFSVLLSLEVITFGYMAVAWDLWEQSLFATAVSFWVSLKLAILGAMILIRAFRGTHQRASQGFCGAGASICGVAIAVLDGFPETPWMMPALGAAFVLLAVWWSSSHGQMVSVAMRTSEACLTPILVMGFCLLWTPAPPLVPLYPAAFTLVILSTTLSAMGFREKETVPTPSC